MSVFCIIIIQGNFEILLGDIVEAIINLKIISSHIKTIFKEEREVKLFGKKTSHNLVFSPQILHAKWSQIKDRDSIDLTEAERLRRGGKNT